jgi:LPXTG-motif cell wall-anchored protein
MVMNGLFSRTRVMVACVVLSAGGALVALPSIASAAAPASAEPTEITNPPVVTEPEIPDVTVPDVGGEAPPPQGISFDGGSIETDMSYDFGSLDGDAVDGDAVAVEAVAVESVAADVASVPAPAVAGDFGSLPAPAVAAEFGGQQAVATGNLPATGSSTTVVGVLTGAALVLFGAAALRLGRRQPLVAG